MIHTLLLLWLAVGGIVCVAVGTYGILPLLLKGRPREILRERRARREERLRLQELAIVETEEQRARAYGLLVANRRQTAALFGLSGHQQADPAAPARAKPERPKKENRKAKKQRYAPDDDDDDDVFLPQAWTPPAVVVESALTAVGQLRQRIDPLAFLKDDYVEPEADTTPALEQPALLATAVEPESPAAEAVDGLDHEMLQLFRDVKPVSTTNQEWVREAMARDLPRVGIAELLVDAIWTARTLKPANEARPAR